MAVLQLAGRTVVCLFGLRTAGGAPGRGRWPRAASLLGLCLLVAGADGAYAAIGLTNTANVSLAATQTEAGNDASDDPDVTGGAGGALVAYTESGSFTCCGASYLGDNLDDGDVGTGNASDGSYAIPDAGALVLSFGGAQTLGSIAIYNGYTNRDDGTYTLRDDASNLLGAWTITTASTGTNAGADSFWLVFDTPVTTTSLTLEASSSDVGGTVSYREIQIREPRVLECDDAVDNDGDGDTDLADADCTDASDPFEGVGVLAAQAISDSQGYLSAPGTPGANPGGVLADGDQFGVSIARLGDLDGDAVPDAVVGAELDDTGGTDRGAIYILLLNSDGTVKSRTKIADGVGGLPANSLGDGDQFGGRGIEPIGDVDGDGVIDLAVGAQRDDTGFSDAGALWILFLNADGTVKTPKKIAEGLGISGLAGNDRFGADVAALGDLDGDGVSELAVGAFGADTPGFQDDGVVWILFLARNGDVRESLKIGQGLAGFGDTLEDFANFGHSLSRLGDLDGNGVPELAVGANRMGPDAGSVWILFLRVNGAVRSSVRIGDGVGGFPPGLLQAGDRFGRGLGAPGDVDGDGVADLLVGADADATLGAAAGAVWVLFLSPDGQVHGQRKLAWGTGRFGTSADGLGDLDGDGDDEWIVGAPSADSGGLDRGVAWVLDVDARPPVCGDGVLAPDEDCDDGGNVSGDLCSASCEQESWFALFGTTSGGGSLDLTVDGNLVVVPTTAGQTIAQVLAAAAAAIEAADPDLETLVAGEALHTNGSIGNVTDNDAGLGVGLAGEVVPYNAILSLELPRYAPSRLRLLDAGSVVRVATPAGRLRALWFNFVASGQDATPVADDTLQSMSMSAFLDHGALTGLWKPPRPYISPVGLGELRLCLLGSCASPATVLPVPLSGLGLGTTTTATADFGQITVMAHHSPWTLSRTTLSSSSDPTITARGFMHGPVSNSVTVGLPEGVLQLVTPTRITSNGPLPGDLAMLTRLTIVLPEPSRLLPFGAGAVLLVGLGWRRR